jgi:hypothetical protein
MVGQASPWLKRQRLSHFASSAERRFTLGVWRGITLFAMSQAAISES